MQAVFQKVNLYSILTLVFHYVEKQVILENPVNQSGCNSCLNLIRLDQDMLLLVMTTSAIMWGWYMFKNVTSLSLLLPICMGRLREKMAVKSNKWDNMCLCYRLCLPLTEQGRINWFWGWPCLCPVVGWDW